MQTFRCSECNDLVCIVANQLIGKHWLRKDNQLMTICNACSERGLPDKELLNETRRCN